MPDTYEEVPYPCLPVRHSHPAHVAALAAIAGFAVPPVERWRVLEIGCGSAANILPMAAEFPDGWFCGVDRARQPLETGRTLAGQAGLANIELHAADLLDWQPPGQFDYIVAHGVYSWVPPAVQERILEICSTALSPEGIAYISYNALPGCHFRRFAWDLMRFHARQRSDPADMLAGAREIAQLMLAQSADSPVRAAVQDEMKTVLEREPAALYHDDLSGLNEPSYLLDFVERAERRGLQYLGDADPHRDDVDGLPLRTGNWLEERQYADFLAARRFRATLLCRAGIALDREVRFDRLSALFAASRAVPREVGKDGAQRFEIAGHKGVTTDHPAVKALLCSMASRWPGSAPVSELFLPEHHGAPTASLLMRLFAGGIVELRTCPPKIAAGVSDMPATTPLLRAQLAAGLFTLANRRHDCIKIEDETGRKLLWLLDGSRGHAELARLLVESGVPPGKAEGKLEPALAGLHRLSVLVA